MNSEESTNEIVMKRALRQVFKHEKENRFLTRRSEDFQVIEEVFDKPTLMTLYSMMNSGFFAHLNGVVGSGKESRVYWGVSNVGKDVAVKIYLMVSADYKKRTLYISGDPRFRTTKRWSHRLVEIWAQKEFRNLKTAFVNSVRVPRPIAVRRNILVTEFIGERGKPPPLLAESEVTKSDYKSIIEMITKLYRKAKLVHADLSEFNIFKGRELVIFDMGSSVDVRHPMSREFLTRDLTNINRFFSKNRIPIVPLDDLVKEIVGDELSSINSSPV